jgi:4-hydroxyproline epimerase
MTATATSMSARAGDAAFPGTVRVVDSHTEGEPTRVVIDGWPELAGATMAERRDDLNARFDALRSGVVCEPRGYDALVGALLTPPIEAGSAAGIIFFNNVGTLGMCGHGTIGAVRTLVHLGRAAGGEIALDTPVGTVRAHLDDAGAVTVRNVPAYVHALDVAVDVPGLGRVCGDIAWGGNWFYIAHVPSLRLTLDRVDALTRAARDVQDALRAQGVTGANGADIDHIEFTADPVRRDADSRNFVLCPGGAYDRSPCGTGTSAKLATLHARGRLRARQPWNQESITGSIFTGWLLEEDGALIPHIRGRAYITGEATLRFGEDDPFRAGFTTA